MRRTAVISSWLASWLLGACTVPPIIPMPQPPELPAAWGEYGQEFSEDTNCPKVSGKYLKVPSIYEVGVTNGRYLDGSDISFYSLFAFHVAMESSEPHEFLMEEPETIALGQTGDGLLIVQYGARAIEKMMTYTFDMANGDFDCVDGFIQFPLSGHYGSIEGMSLNGQELKRLRANRAGDLVGVRSFGPYRSMRAIDDLNFVHEFYFFRRL